MRLGWQNRFDVKRSHSVAKILKAWAWVDDCTEVCKLKGLTEEKLYRLARLALCGDAKAALKAHSGQINETLGGLQEFFEKRFPPFQPLSHHSSALT
jgi:hypothetical protein